MHDIQAELVIAAIEAGHSFGYSHKEGMMSVSLQDNVYHFYEAGDDRETRKSFADRAAFVAFLRGESDQHYRTGLESDMFRQAHAATERGGLDAARASLEQALDLGHELARGGLVFVALAEPEREGYRQEARAQLAALLKKRSGA